jgi:beta-lactamase class A
MQTADQDIAIIHAPVAAPVLVHTPTYEDNEFDEHMPPATTTIYDLLRYVDGYDEPEDSPLIDELADAAREMLSEE